MNQRALPFDELLTHAGWLRRLAVALVRDADQAQEVAQGTLIAAWEHPPAPDVPVRPWLSRVARNRAQDLRRSERRREVRQLAAADLQPTTAPSPEQLIGDLQIHRDVATCVSELAAPYREAVLLRYYEGLTAAQIARQLGVPAGTVRWRLKEGIDQVRRALDRRHEGDRKRWALALVPLLPRQEAAAPKSPHRLAWLAAAAVPLIAGVVALTFGSGKPNAPTTERTSVIGSARVVPPVDRQGTMAPPRFAPPPAEIEPALPPTHPESLVRHMLSAITRGSYDDFLTYADDGLKAAVDKSVIEQLGQELGPRLRVGFVLEPLGYLHREAHLTYLWKLTPGDGGDEHVVSLSIASDQVSGFFVQ